VSQALTGRELQHCHSSHLLGQAPRNRKREELKDIGTTRTYILQDFAPDL
jgi:hypothetical protein